MSVELLPAPHTAMSSVEVVRHTMDELKAIRTFVKEEMVKDVDFGLIPGTGSKPTLLLPGAQKVAMYFNACPRFAIQTHELGEGHVEYIVTTDLIHRASGRVVGSGLGSCSTMESKYRFRSAKRSCPMCGRDAIIKGKAEYGGGWLCFKAKGGCGAKFSERDPKIVGQAVGQSENENIHDVRNTVLKMAKKRSQVDAAHGLGCLSELFTQDLEDVYDLAPSAPNPAPADLAGPQRGEVPEEVRTIPDRFVREYESWCQSFLTRQNGRWLDKWTDRKTGEIPDGIDDLANEFQFNNHLLKWGHAEGLVDPPVSDPNFRTRQKAVAKLWMEHTAATKAEAVAYLTRLAEEQTARQSEAREGREAVASQDAHERGEPDHGDAYEPEAEPEGPGRAA